VLLPSLSTTSLRLRVAVTLVDTSRLLACRCEAASFTVLVDRVDDPIDTRITTDGLVLRIDEDDFEVLVGRVLVDPVGVEDTEIWSPAANTFFSSGTERALILQLIDTLVGRLAVCSTLGRWSLAATTAHADTIDDIALLGLVSKTTSLVGTGWARGTMDDVQLAILPAPNAEQEA